MNFKRLILMVKKIGFFESGTPSRRAELRSILIRNISLASFLNDSIISLGRIVILWFVYTPSASAYVDPGSGMLFWQGFVAAIGAVLVFFRNPLAVVKDWIKRLLRK